MLRVCRLFTLIALSLSFGQPAWSALPPKQDLLKFKQQLQQRRSAMVSKSTHKKLQRLHSWIQKEKYPQSLELLSLLINNTKKRPFELAQAYHLQGVVFAQMENYQAASESFVKALKLEALPYTPTLTLLFGLAQVQMADKQSHQAQETLELWMALAEHIRPETRAFVAAVYAENQQMQLALDQIRRAIATSEKVNPAWLRLAMALHSELGQQEQAVEMAKQLTALRPNETSNWKQLSGLLLNTNKPPVALASLELGNRLGGGFKEKGEVMNLVGLRLQEGLPLEAAHLLQTALDKGQIEGTQKHWEILSAAWFQAEELDKSIAALQQAAKKSSQGQLEARLGQLYMEQENWSQALSHLRQALKKGGLKRPQQIHLGIGMSLYQQGKLHQALKALKAAHGLSKKQQASPLVSWIQHIESEISLGKTGTQVAKGSN